MNHTKQLNKIMSAGFRYKGYWIPFTGGKYHLRTKSYDTLEEATAAIDGMAKSWSDLIKKQNAA